MTDPKQLDTSFTSASILCPEFTNAQWQVPFRDLKCLYFDTSPIQKYYFSAGVDKWPVLKIKCKAKIGMGAYPQITTSGSLQTTEDPPPDELYIFRIPYLYLPD